MYIIPLFYYTCKKKRPVSKNFFRTPQGDGGRLPLFRSTESCELSGPPAGPLPGFPLPGRKEARCRGRTAPFLRGDSGQCWFIQKGRGRFAEPKLSAACFVVQSCLADADFVVFSNYCLIGTRLKAALFLLSVSTKYTLSFRTGPRLPVIPRQSSDWRGNPPG